MKPLLKDPEELPTIENLAKYLGTDSLALYQQLLVMLHKESFKEDWNYYNDGKHWLAKILYKKKNLGWISIWESGVKITVYFGERIWPQLMTNELFQQLEASDVEIHKSGKLTAVLVPILNETSLQNAVALVKFKKAAK